MQSGNWRKSNVRKTTEFGEGHFQKGLTLQAIDRIWFIVMKVKRLLAGVFPF
jgi:hypothetical protein